MPEATGPGPLTTSRPGTGTTSAGPATIGTPLDVDASRLAAGETPADWVEILSNDEACRQAVPPDWIESGIPGQVLSPEIKAASIVANDPITDWTDHVAYLQATYFTDGQEVVVETGDVFLLRATKRGGGSHVLVLNGGTSSCGIVLAIDEAGVEQYTPIGRQILYTLAELG